MMSNMKKWKPTLTTKTLLVENNEILAKWKTENQQTITDKKVAILSFKKKTEVNFNNFIKTSIFFIEDMKCIM